MRKSKLTEAQTMAMLSEGDAGVGVEELCRKYQVSSATYYKLKSKYAGMSVSQLKRLNELELENRRLKAMYADVSLERDVIKDVLEKKYPGLIDDI